VKEFSLFGRNMRKPAGDGLFKTSEGRTQQFKNELAAASAANDAKTARLRALRLEKERQDKATAAVQPSMLSSKTKRKPIRRVNG
jgi:hypothetical protein